MSVEGKTAYHDAIEFAFEMLMEFDENGVITRANQKAITLLEYDELCGRNIQEIFLKSIVELHVSLMKNQEDEHYHEWMAYRKNKTCFSCMVRIVQTQEEPKRYMCMALDNSQLVFLQKRNEQIEKEASQAMEVKSQFVANVTHELRTPVNGFLGNTKELLQMESDEKKLGILHMLERGCNDMNSIINNILDFSKLESGKFTLEKREFNFRDMIDYVKANHKNKITEKGLDFFVTISPEIPDMIVGDELRIVQVLNNLLSNACKFTSVGKIVLEAVRTAQVKNKMELFFIVIDTGIGISAADQDKLFKSFSQVDSSISRRYGGTGLGLNISKQLVEMMGGSIHVESELGKGTMFSFSIWVENAGEQEIIVPPSSMNNESALDMFRNQGMNQDIKQFGEPENMKEIENKMSKLILSVEMENWEKSEMFLEALKQLTSEAPREIKTATLKLKMAVQKADYDKTIEAYETLKRLIEAE